MPAATEFNRCIRNRSEILVRTWTTLRIAWHASLWKTVDKRNMKGAWWHRDKGRNKSASLLPRPEPLWSANLHDVSWFLLVLELQVQIPGRLHITWRTPAVLGDLKAGCKDVLSMHYFIMAPFKMQDKSLYDSRWLFHESRSRTCLKRCTHNLNAFGKRQSHDTFFSFVMHKRQWTSCAPSAFFNLV